MAGYDNSRYTYQNVLKGNGYYQQDTALKYSEGVETMQTKLNKAGFWCGTPDGKFGAGTDAVFRMHTVLRWTGRLGRRRF